MAPELLSQFSRFTVVGALATAVHYCVLIFSVHIIGIYPIEASASGFAVGALVGYAMNYRLTFKSNKRHFEALPKFLIVALAGLAINTLIMMILLSETQAHYLACQVLATGIVLIWNFSANRWWTFGATGRVERR